MRMDVVLGRMCERKAKRYLSSESHGSFRYDRSAELSWGVERRADAVLER
jgi:hypothetical protein